MWVRKTQEELAAEKAARKGRTTGAKIAGFIVFALILLDFKYRQYGPSLTRSWEEVLTGAVWFALAGGFLVYFLSKRSIEWTGSHLCEEEWVCLGCEKSFATDENTVNRLLVFGKKKTKPWEIQACSTPELCDLARKHEVRWVENDV